MRNLEATVATAVGVLIAIGAAGCNGGKTGKGGPAGPAALVTAGDGQSGLVSESLGQPLAVTVRDAQGNPLEQIVVEFAVTAGGGTLSAQSATSDAQGRAQVELTLGASPGPNTVTATVSPQGGTPLVATFNATALAVTGASASASGGGQVGVVGTQLAAPLRVTVLDAQGAPAPNVVVDFQVTAGGGSVSPASATTDAQGMASTTHVLGTAVGAHTVTAQVPGVSSPQTFNATATAAAAASLRIQSTPPNAGPGAAFSLNVEVSDAFGNPASADVSLAIGTNPVGGSLSTPGGVTVTASNGIATFSGASLDNVGDGYTLVATASGLPAATSGAFNVVRPAANDGLGHLDSSAMNFLRGGNNDHPNASSFNTPASVVIDTVDHRAFVADLNNNRVLVFSLSPTDEILPGQRHATWVLGQSDFTTVSARTTQDGLSRPFGLAYDSATKRLFVADSGNNRVVVYDLSAGVSSGMNASIVLGQAGFTSATAATTRAGLSFPVGLHFDSAGQRLFVADFTNNRTLVHSTTALATGQDAAFVLGQADFTSNAAAATQSGQGSPTAIELDPASQRLFVSNLASHRVLIYDVSAISNGENAVGVLGQPDFTSSASATTAAGLNQPIGLAFEPGTGRLYVCELLNRRVLVYDAQTPNGVAASHVLGQANFTTTTAPDPTRASVGQPVGLVLAGARLWVAGTHRILVHDTSALANNQDALEGLGQIDGQVMDFDRHETNGGFNPSSFSSPRGVALDPVGHRLFVTDSSNHRVLIYALANDNSFSGQTRVAIAVLGQPSLTTNGAGVAANRMFSPDGLAWDGASNLLYVADADNHRVLVFDAPNLVTNGSAIRVLGQTNFTTRSPATTPSGMRTPRALALDGNQRLFVSDSDNHRVLVFDAVTTLADGAPATSAIGQANLTSGGLATTQTGLSFPRGLAYESATQRLYVADQQNHRVLSYDLALSAGNGRPALNVLGQPNFTSGGSATTRVGMNAPSGLCLDAAGQRLYVTDELNHRVLIHSLAGLQDGQEASSYFGQDSYLTSTSALGATGFSSPTAVVCDPVGKRAFIADRANHRLVIYTTP